jgi:hypothetical protein
MHVFGKHPVRANEVKQRACEDQWMEWILDLADQVQKKWAKTNDREHYGECIHEDFL